MAVVLACFASSVAHAQKPAAPNLDSVFEKLDVYLEKYEGELSAVVADEILVQEAEGRFLQRKTRRILSDIAFLRLPGEFEWLGFRHVKMLDGKPVAAAFDALVSVDFRENTGLGLMVPTTMREEFFAGPGRRAWGDASYSNYRRFQTSARIVPPPFS